MYRIQILITFSCLALGTLQASAQHQRQQDVVPQIASKVHFVESFGEWRHLGDAGYLRVLVQQASAQAEQSFVYIQWLEEADYDSDSAADIVAERAVDEINTASAYQVMAINTAQHDGVAVIDLLCKDLGSGHMTNLQIRSDAPMSYDFVRSEQVTWAPTSRWGGGYSRLLHYYIWSSF